MLITIDGNQADITLEDEKTVGSLLSGLESAFEDCGYFVSGISIDGENIGAQAIDAVYDDALAGIEHIDIRTSSAEELQNEARNGFVSMEDEIAEVTARMEDFSLDIQTGNEARALETVRLFSSATERLLRILKEINPASFDEQEFINRFSATLKEFFAAYQDGDTVLSGDLAEYELSPLLRGLYAASKAGIMEQNV
jgi:hypothetical protein